MRTPNHLVHETSPYLLQHAYNPVDWYPWGDEALKKAVSEDKLLLISIGYSSCHWCHVMERESFENEEVAELMNRHFVCIKVDREERPDIDQVYMSAVQLMTGRGGWPLNCFALPDGRPVYGGTYFPRAQWLQVLMNLSNGYQKDKPRFVDYAVQLTEGVRNYDVVPLDDMRPERYGGLLKESISRWEQQFDRHEGGASRAPKFPMPNNYLFLLKYQVAAGSDELRNYIGLTLRKMAWGGIYDQLGGGFSRYSVDGLWKVPHFEKMLYDNAQLVSLYSEAYRYHGEPVYKTVVEQTLTFIESELSGSDSNFYSALDADSEGVEGKYYTWTRDELEQLLGDDFHFFATVFNVNERGLWEHDRYVLLRNKSDEELAAQFGISFESFQERLSGCMRKAMQVRENRVRPGLDDKTLLSWNALMITGYADAYDVFGNKNWMERGVANADFILNNMVAPDGGLYHSFKAGKATISGFLEDYAFFIQALIRLYQVTFNTGYLLKARFFTEYALQHFHNENHPLLYFTPDTDPRLITRYTESQDNVMPSSNSQMAMNLFFLGIYFENDEWSERSKRMLDVMSNLMMNYGSAYSNWLTVLLYRESPLKELVITGRDALRFRNEMVRLPLPPGLVLAGSETKEDIALLRGRYQPNRTLFYVCTDKVCQQPVESVTSAVALLK